VSSAYLWCSSLKIVIHFRISLLNVLESLEYVKSVGLSIPLLPSEDMDALYQKTLIALSLFLSQHYPTQPTRFGNLLALLELLKSSHSKDFFSSHISSQTLKFVITTF